MQSQDETENALHAFFVQLVGKVATRSHTLDLDYLNVTSFDLASLDVHFYEEEDWEAVRSLLSEKVPGLDGFTALFYQICWGHH